MKIKHTKRKVCVICKHIHPHKPKLKAGEYAMHVYICAKCKRRKAVVTA